MAGAEGGRARAQVPAVADTGRRRDGRDGHWARGSGEQLPVPWRTGNKQITPEFVKPERHWAGRGGEQRKARANQRRNEGERMKENELP